jgi:hypothetical protein
MVVSTDICRFGWKARDFALKGVDGKTYSLAEVRGSKGTLVVFICNHCPYVKASINRIVAEANALRGIGIGTIAIMPNDTDVYPEDSFDNMKTFAAQHAFLMLSTRLRKSHAPMTLSAHPISSASMFRTSCNTAVALTLRG